MGRYCLLLIFIIGAAQATLYAAVVVYPQPAGYAASKDYRIVISQDGRQYETFIYVSDAQFPKVNKSQTTQFSSFSFTGTITIRVEKLQGFFERCEVLPTAKNIKPLREGNTISFQLSKPENLAVEFDKSIQHPLLIFANPMESDIPDPTDVNVMYFGPGIHQPADTIFLKANQTLYLAGGAVLRSHVYGANATGAAIKGRGIIDGRRFGHTHGRLIRFDAQSHDVTLDGFIVLDAPGYYITSGGKRTHANNVKGLGWWFNTDGFGFGEDGLIENCFLKCNDDAIKLYNSGTRVLRTTIWQMENGAPFQMSWNSNGNRNGFLVKDCDVIHVDHAWDNPNEGVFVAIHGGNGHLSDFLFEDIRVENIDWRLFTIQIMPNEWAKADHPGSVSNLVFKNITVTTTQGLPLQRLSVIQGYDSQSKVSDVRIERLTINGNLVTDLQADGFEINAATTKNVFVVPALSKPARAASQSPIDSLSWTNPITTGLSTYGMQDFFLWQQDNLFYLLATEKVKPNRKKRGIILYSSTNLKQWREEQYILNRLSFDSLAWFADEWQAPELHKINEKYVLVFASRNNTTHPYKPLGIAMAVADDMFGPYTMLTPDTPLTIGNNPTLQTDEEGHVQLLFDKDGRFYMAPVDISNGQLLAPPKEILGPQTMGADYRFLDAPQLTKQRGLYYLMFTSFYAGYVVKVRYMVSANIAGPYRFLSREPLLSFVEAEADENVKMPHRNRNGYAPPTQVIFQHRMFPVRGNKWLMSYHSSEKYSEPYLCLEPVIFLPDGTIGMVAPKQKAQLLLP